MAVQEHYRGDTGEMRYRIKIEGSSPLLMHSARGIDEFSPEKQEIAELTKKRGTNKTVIDAKRIAELETSLSLWLDAQGAVTIPPEAIRACIETSARKLKEGPLVREGMLVEGTTFHYDQERYGETLEELSKTTQFSAVVVVQRNRINRTRAQFEDWACTFVLDCDDELIDRGKVEAWLRIAGKRIGLGDWRPEKSGLRGRFVVAEFEELGQ